MPSKKCGVVLETDRSGIRILLPDLNVTGSCLFSRCDLRVAGTLMWEILALSNTL